MQQGKPVTIRGVTYPSRREAGRALGISHQAITKAEKKGTLDTVGFNLSPLSKPVTVRGKKFPSISAAARHFGCKNLTIRRWIGDLPSSGPRAIPCRVGEKEYTSLKDAANDLGIPVNYINDVAERV